MNAHGDNTESDWCSFLLTSSGTFYSLFIGSGSLVAHEIELFVCHSGSILFFALSNKTFFIHAAV